MARPIVRARGRGKPHGFSLVELMVGITIALVVTLVIFNVLVASETRKRSTTAVNDINQSGAYSAYLLDRAIRSAGSGITNQWFTLRLQADLEGCRLSVTRGGTALLPASTFPAPFATMPLAPRLAPVIIDQFAASDVITVMSGTQGRSEAGPRVIGPSVNGVAVVNPLGFAANDLVLFGHSATEGDCLVSQVANTFAPQVPPTINPVEQDLPLGGTYVNAAGASTVTGNLALGLGNATTNRPQFKMYGVRQSDRTLVEFDLLNLDGTGVEQPLADGVIEMRAVYGVDTNDDNVIDSWQEPTGTTWGAAALRAGTADAAANLRRIVAVHVALVLRTSLPEREAVPASRTFTLYSGLVPAGLPTRDVTYTGGTTDRFRYRVIETTIPLRNNLL